MVELFLARLLEGMHIAALRIHALHHVLDHAVFAGRVHGLENQQHRPAILRVEPFLQLGQAFDPFGQEVLGLFLFDVEIVGVARIPILECGSCRDRPRDRVWRTWLGSCNVSSFNHRAIGRQPSMRHSIFLRGIANSKPAGKLPAGDEPEQAS